MRIQWVIAGVLVTISMVLTGCGDKKEEPKPAPTTANRDLLPHEKVVREFINAAFKGDDAAAFALITPVAQEAYKKSGIPFQPPAIDNVKCQITGSNPIKGMPGAYGVYLTMTEQGEDGSANMVLDCIWGVKKIGNDYRISAVMINEGENVVHSFNFEDPVASLQEYNKAVAAQQTAQPQAQPQAGQPAGQFAEQQQYTQGVAVQAQPMAANQQSMPIQQQIQQTPQPMQPIGGSQTAQPIPINQPLR
ncbi:MAG: hypothetical protein FWC50_01050 [Planctomycetaceae bacterium]|nr:hypothetical protein [Planctomycetaceae bacterium]